MPINHPLVPVENPKDDERLVEIATMVLDWAAEIDPNAPEGTEKRVRAWAGVFNGRVWEREAELAVEAFYAGAPERSIMPGDVVAFIASYPLEKSSRERIQDYILSYRPHPYAPVLAALTGLEFDPWAGYGPTWSADLHKKDGLTDKERRAKHVEMHGAWVDEHMEELIDRIQAHENVEFALQVLNNQWA